METLFDPAQAAETRQRILRLHAGSERQWGSMTLPQALAHCTSGLQMAMGSVNPKRASFPASLLGPLIKPLVLAEGKPMRRNAPSSPELFPAQPAQCSFDHQRAELLAALDRFISQREACCTKHPHPFFGPLKPHQWGVLMYKHLDHHLRQFGA